MQNVLTMNAPGGPTHLYSDGGMAPPTTACGVELDADTVELAHGTVTSEAAPALTCTACAALVDAMQARARAKAARLAKEAADG